MKAYLLWYLLLLLIIFTLFFEYIPSDFTSWATSIVNAATIVSFIFIWILNKEVRSLNQRYDEIKRNAKLSMLAREEHPIGLEIAKNYACILNVNPIKVSELEKVHNDLLDHLKFFFPTYDSTVKNDLLFSLKFLKKVNLKKVTLNENVRKSLLKSVNEIIKYMEIDKKVRNLDEEELRKKTEEDIKHE